MTSIRDYTGTPEQILSVQREVEKRKEMCREFPNLEEFPVYNADSEVEIVKTTSYFVKQDKPRYGYECKPFTPQKPGGAF